MNTCKRCGLPFYGACEQNYCAPCRTKVDTQAEASTSDKVKTSNPDGAKRTGFWRRLFGGKKQS